MSVVRKGLIFDNDTEAKNFFKRKKTPFYMERFWYPAMNRWSDQTGTAHLLSDGGIAKPLCGAKVYSLGGGFKNAADAGCRECLVCKKAEGK
jgi:hypothetical protein